MSVAALSPGHANNASAFYLQNCKEFVPVKKNDTFVNIQAKNVKDNAWIRMDTTEAFLHIPVRKVKIER